MWKSQPTGNKLSVIGAWSGHVIRYKIFGAPIIITGTVESKVVKFCTRVGYINSSNRMTYHQQKGCGYGHGTVLNFCHLSWCSVARVCHSSSWRMSNSWKPASSTEACLLSYCDRVLCITTVSTISRAAFQMNKVRPLPARFSSSICPGREPLVTQAFVGQMPSCHVTDSSDTNCPVLSFLNLLPDCWRKGCCSLYAESLTIFPLSLSLSDRHDKLCRDFFQKMRDPSSCIHHFLPPPRDPVLTFWLRNASTYPRPSDRTNCYKSFIHHALLKFQ